MPVQLALAATSAMSALLPTPVHLPLTATPAMSALLPALPALLLALPAQQPPAQLFAQPAHEAKLFHLVLPAELTQVASKEEVA